MLPVSLFLGSTSNATLAQDDIRFLWAIRLIM